MCKLLDPLLSLALKAHPPLTNSSWNPICLQYFLTFLMFLIHSHRCLNFNPVLSPALGKRVWAVNLDVSNNLWWIFYWFNYLLIFAAVVVYVVLLQRSWSEFHKGCNSVRLWRKTQDNISKTQENQTVVMCTKNYQRRWTIFIEPF